QPDLAKVLLYHVVSGKVMSTDLSDGLKAPTLNGSELTFDLKNGVMVNSSQVIAADIESQNGVVHVIDTVLVPENFVYQAVSQDTAVPKTGVSDLTNPLFISIILLVGAIALKKKILN
ncbi:MAG TPA: hypothetical protein DCS67_12655, partial [Clostridiales bacterium UBA8960]|nr:hypothetical protein [Clostridiales bacterium UBA8960]